MTDYRALRREYESAGSLSLPRPSDSVEDLLAARGVAALADGAPMGAVEQALRQLAALVDGSADPLRRLAAREGAVNAVRRAGISGAARLVDAALGAEARGGHTLQGRALALQDPPPWPERVDGTALLTALEQTFQRFVVLPEGGATALALWTVHAHALDAAQVSPLLALRSPQKRCGKSVALSVLGAVTPRHVMAANITPPALFRAIEAGRPTLLVDEGDTFLRDNVELRGILNSGHMRTGTVIRTVGDDFEPRTFSTWGAKAIALIGELPATLADRAISILLRRRKLEEQVERLRLDRLGELTPLQRQAARWALDNMDALRAADPEVPAELNDRAADNWRPLIAIADRVAGSFPARARDAARMLSVGDEGDLTPGIKLLADMRDVFNNRQADRVATAEILEALAGRDDRPWPEWKNGRPITARQLARVLKPFGIAPRTVRDGGTTFKGYLTGEFADAFARYLPPDPSHTSQSSNQAAGSGPANRHNGAVVTQRESPDKARSASLVTDVTELPSGTCGGAG